MKLRWRRINYSTQATVEHHEHEVGHATFGAAVLRPEIDRRPLVVLLLEALQPDIALLGDAAHLMPPYASEGVNMAMLDALELSQCLTSKQFPDVQAALAHYEQQMRQRASAVADETLQQTEALHAPHALDYLVNLFVGTETVG